MARPEFNQTITEFAEFVGSEIKRIEKKIPIDGGGSQSSDSPIINGNGRPDKPETTQGKITISEWMSYRIAESHTDFAHQYRLCSHFIAMTVITLGWFMLAEHQTTTISS